MANTIRAAGIDCGTNSIRLLIADVDPKQGKLQDISRLMEIVRLGEDVDRTGWFAADALKRTLNAVARYGELCRQAGVEKLRFVATSATRDAANRNIFLKGVRSELGVEAEVIDGLEEARLSFTGALSALPVCVPATARHTGARPASPGCTTEPQTTSNRPDPLPGPYLCVDLGGGSTELALGTEAPVFAYSMDVGCVRITERHLRSDPPTSAQVSAATQAIDAIISEAAHHVPLGQASTVIGLAGSITTITAHALGLRRYEPNTIDGAVLPVEQVLRSCRELWESTRQERAALGFMHPGRVDVIGAGALVWSRVLERVRLEVEASGRYLGHVVTSEHDILDGITLSAAASPAGKPLLPPAPEESFPPP